MKILIGTNLYQSRYNVNIVDMIKTTADNQYELMLAIAEHIEKLEQEIRDLKAQLDDKSSRPRQRQIKPLEIK